MKIKFKNSIVFIATIFFVNYICIGCSNKDISDEEYNKIYQKGFDAGYENGYSENESDIDSDFEMYREGYREGALDGYEYGYDRGYNDSKNKIQYDSEPTINDLDNLDLN